MSEKKIGIDHIMSKNDITNDEIRSGNRKEDKSKYDSGWERIWGNKGEKKEEVKKDERS